MMRTGILYPSQQQNRKEGILHPVCDLKSEQMRSQFNPEQHSTLIETGVILRMMLSLMASLLMLRNRKHTAYLVNQPLKKCQTKCPFNLTAMIQMKL